MTVHATKRLICTTCMRPQRTCICRWVAPTAHPVEVVVLQHPLEVHNAKGSARLLHLSLPGSRLLTGEVFAETELRTLLNGPSPTPSPIAQSATKSGRKHAILLYPETAEDVASDLSAPPALTADVLRDPSELRLIVLDGTWRKSRKMLYLNPLLQQLPRLSLTDVPASRYLIRKAQRVDQLSTLEAVCVALAQLEGDGERFRPLLSAFDGFVAQQLASRERSVAPK